MPVSTDADGVLKFPVLVGDIGGTNARFAILPGPQADAIEFETVSTAAFPDIDVAIERAILAPSPVRPRSAVLAIAAPVKGEEIRLTNCPWTVRPQVLIDRLGFDEVVILNDFEAQALAVIAIGPDHLVQVGGGTADPDASRVVLGPGTGLGVAGLVNANGVWVPVPGEGGHVDMGPRTPRDFAVFPHIERIEGRISGEQMLCGRGLVNLYRAVAAADAVPEKLHTPAEITGAALAGTDGVAEEALDLFVTCLGRLAGDLALIFMARGGVYLTGGIAQKIVPALEQPRFRAAFEDKAPHSALMRDLPVFVMTHPLAALLGLAAFARTPHSFHIRTTGRHWRAGRP
jgi:glucokinase